MLSAQNVSSALCLCRVSERQCPSSGSRLSQLVHPNAGSAFARCVVAASSPGRRVDKQAGLYLAQVRTQLGSELLMTLERHWELAFDVCDPLLDENVEARPKRIGSLRGPGAHRRIGGRRRCGHLHVVRQLTLLQGLLILLLLRLVEKDGAMCVRDRLALCAETLVPGAGSLLRLHLVTRVLACLMPSTEPGFERLTVVWHAGAGRRGADVGVGPDGAGA